MATLTTAMADALNGHGRLAMLAGEPGIGKTRTAQELASHAENLGARSLWGRCSSAQGAPSYWPWVQVIRSYVQGQDAAQIAAVMGISAADIAEIVPEVKAVLPDLPPPPSLEPEQARFRLFDSITNFLKSASQQQPLVLVLEDLHWADEPSLLLLNFLARELSGCRLLVVGTYRDTEIVPGHPLNQTLGEVAREPAFPQVSLGGLDEQEESRFIELAAGFAPPADLVTAVHAMAEGNPLFMTEVVRLLVDSGELDAESASRSREWNFMIPGAVNAVIRSRLDRLTPSCQQIVSLASLTGREFDLRSLEWLITNDRVEMDASLSNENLLGLLEEALAARVIEEVPENVGRYQFSHALIQETLSSQLSSVRRARMHADIGQALEDRYDAEADNYAAEIAYHFGNAETGTGSDKLVHYSLLAGEQALAAYAAEDALTHFERGLAARNFIMSESNAAPDEETARLLFGLGKAQRATFPRRRQTEIPQTMKPAFDYWARNGDISQALAVIGHIGGPFQRGSIKESILTEALNLVPTGSLESARVLNHYADMLDSSPGDRESAAEVLDQVLEIARREDDADMENQVLANIAHLNLNGFEHQESLDNCVRAIELIPRLKGPPDNTVYWVAVRDLIALGRIEEARPYAARQLELAVVSRSRFHLTQAFHANGYLAYKAGDWQVAREFCDRGLEIDELDARLLIWRSELESQLGNFESGNTYIDRILEIIRNAAPNTPQMEHSNIAMTVGASALITGQTDRFEEAASAAALILSLPFGLEARTAQYSRTGLAMMAIQTGDVSAATEQYSFLSSWQIFRTPLNIIDGNRVLGLLARTMGEIEAAIGHFEDSLTFCRDAGYRPEVAWICHDYADALLTRGNGPGRSVSSSKTAASALLDESLAIATELGMLPLMERVKGLIDKLGTRPTPRPVYPSGLTQREVEVIRLVSSGMTDRAIAEVLIISSHTVSNHVKNILNKTDSANRTEAATYAVLHGLVASDENPEDID